MMGTAAERVRFNFWRLGKRLKDWLPSVRTALLLMTGFGFISAALWVVALPLGLASVGISLLVLEGLTESGKKGGRRI